MHGGQCPFCFDATLEQWLFLVGGGTKSIPIAWTLGLGPGRKKIRLASWQTTRTINFAFDVQSLLLPLRVIPIPVLGE